jgi:Ca2+-binding EF-hand superfamily protein
MKKSCSPSLGLALSLIGASLTFTAFAGGTPTLTEQFNTADADTSGFLTDTEFGSAYTPALSKGKLKKSFRTADDDGDRLVSLAEWLAFRRAEILKNPRKFPESAFEVADLDLSGSLDLFEFAPLTPGKNPLTEKRKRFLMADADDDDLVTLDEWLDYLESPQPDTSGLPFLKFDLADLDESGTLTIEEFAYAYPPAVKPQVIEKKFTGKDANEDDLLTRDEWNPGG